MTRIGVVFIAIVVASAAIIIWLADEKISENKQSHKIEREYYHASIKIQNFEIDLLRKKLAIEKLKNAENDSILVVYKESMKVHSMGLQDANWRLIQLKKLIEDAEEE